jgi:hypothetical protein
MFFPALLWWNVPANCYGPGESLLIYFFSATVATDPNIVPVVLN